MNPGNRESIPATARGASQDLEGEVASALDLLGAGLTEAEW